MNIKEMSTQELTELLATIESLSIASADHVQKTIKEIKQEIKKRAKK